MSNADSEINDRFLKIVGAGSGVMHVVIFTVLGELALENVAYGAIVGLFAGAGAYLFLPWFMRISALQNESSDELAFSEITRRAGGNVRMGVVGLGLELGGIVMFAVGLSVAEPDPATGIVVAVVVALVVSLVASELLGR